MKIGVNAAPLLKPFTGIGQYTKNLFMELAKIDNHNEYILVVHGALDDGVHESFPPNVKFKILPERKLPLVGMRKTWWEQVSLPEFFLKEKVDIAFFPYPSNPWSNDWYAHKGSGGRGIKTVVTVHDCIPWARKDYRHGVLSKLYHGQTKKAVAKADMIFTVSKHSKEELIKICKVDSHKVHVVYNDASDVYKNDVDPAFADEVLERFGFVGGGFFLYCGGYDKRKNVDYLVKEYMVSGSDKRLVLVGGKLFNSKLYKSFDAAETGGAPGNGGAGDAGKIVKTGFLTEQELVALYSRCSAFVHMSKEEGFNIPLLEAANCGAPLILSDIDVHREIAGGFATFVDISETGALAKILKSSEFKSSAGLAEKYSWKKSAEEVKRLLQKIAGMC